MGSFDFTALLAFLKGLFTAFEKLAEKLGLFAEDDDTTDDEEPVVEQ